MNHPNLKLLAKYETTYDPIGISKEVQTIEAHKILISGSIIFFSNDTKLNLSFKSLDSFNSDFKDCIADDSFRSERIAYTEAELKYLYDAINQNY